MRRLLLLMGLCALAVLALAPAALAQGAGPGGEGPCTGTPFELYLPEVNGCVTTEGMPDPGEAIVYDADTREPIGTLDEVSASMDTASPTASPSATATASASAATATQYQYSSALPETGGMSPATLLAIIPAILLVGGGLLSARLIRRR